MKHNASTSVRNRCRALLDAAMKNTTLAQSMNTIRDFEGIQQLPPLGIFRSRQFRVENRTRSAMLKPT
ncbi:hypothetical protein [Burkholderia lata]|uniref:hypothetical protein n=1 Tax=Burkholderia lata (strain ATCC 17760 / DSM 23089 / LMG 22485 / NCIMB 9086 / R18194 / 383) TaxID=482957 RepID=UPI00399BBD0C